MREPHFRRPHAVESVRSPPDAISVLSSGQVGQDCWRDFEVQPHDNGKPKPRASKCIGRVPPVQAEGIK